MILAVKPTASVFLNRLGKNGVRSRFLYNLPMTAHRPFRSLNLFLPGALLLCLLLGSTPVLAAKKKMISQVQGNTAFAFRLYREVGKQKGNLFFSPYSISSALAMAYAGAGGGTKKEMASALSFSLEDNDLHTAFRDLNDLIHPKEKRERGYALRVANRIWVEKSYPLFPSYTELLSRFYGAGAVSLDFIEKADAAREVINQWVEAQTENKIRNLLGKGAVDTLTRAILTNAIYFKGDWKEKFDVRRTKKEPFYLGDGKEVQVSMMHRTDKILYAEKGDVQAIGLPYRGDDLSMWVFLPKKRNELPRLEKSFDERTYENFFRKATSRKVVLSLPKFEMTNTFQLSKTLRALGMKEAFGNSADFSGMTGTRELKISDVIHQAFVVVNEEGTEAAAATAVQFMSKGRPAAPESTIVFRADHPFLFVIYHNRTASILFMGRLSNPTE